MSGHFAMQHNERHVDDLAASARSNAGQRGDDVCRNVDRDDGGDDAAITGSGAVRGIARL